MLVRHVFLCKNPIDCASRHLTDDQALYLCMHLITAQVLTVHARLEHEELLLQISVDAFSLC